MQVIYKKQNLRMALYPSFPLQIRQNDKPCIGFLRKSGEITINQKRPVICSRSTMVSRGLRSRRLETPATCFDFRLVKSFSLQRGIWGVRCPCCAAEKRYVLKRQWERNLSGFLSNTFSYRHIEISTWSTVILENYGSHMFNLMVLHHCLWC